MKNTAGTFFAIGLLFIFTSATAQAIPAQVVIIRHAEKPDNGPQVDSQGCERAFMLPNFFRSDDVVNQFGKPVAIYAMSPKDVEGTLRPVETISPTAKSLGLIINDQYVKADSKDMIKDIFKNPSYENGTVLIVWEHDKIPKLAHDFGVDVPPEATNWPGHVFDEAWVIDFSPNKGKIRNFVIIPEKALPSDNPNGGLDGWSAQPTGISNASLPAEVTAECANNNALNTIAKEQVSDTLPGL